MSKRTEFQNWSEIHQPKGNRFQCFEKVLKEGWRAHTLDWATFAEFAEAARKEFEVKLSNLYSEFQRWQKTRPHQVSGTPATYRIRREMPPASPPRGLLTLVDPRAKPETPA